MGYCKFEFKGEEVNRDNGIFTQFYYYNCFIAQRDLNSSSQISELIYNISYFYFLLKKKMSFYNFGYPLLWRKTIYLNILFMPYLFPSSICMVHSIHRFLKYHNLLLPGILPQNFSHYVLISLFLINSHSIL